jgi:4-amino-4-deoxy-L-arabinose transferase-like glycosyltransferase
MAGGAAGMKYLGLVAVLAIAAVAVGLAWRRLSYRQVLVFAVPAIVVALPWYVKNAVLTGNPFYPHIFGGLNPSAAAEL